MCSLLFINHQREVMITDEKRNNIPRLFDLMYIFLGKKLTYQGKSKCNSVLHGIIYTGLLEGFVAIRFFP